jgi:uncharacterized protein (TIGR00288 family)
MVSPKHKDQRVAILIDTQNLYYSAKNLFDSKVNFKAVLESALADRKLIRAFAYVVQTKTREEKPFFEALINLGIETRVRPLQEFYGGLKKADWDVGIVVDAIRVATSVDVIVLASGDGDFIPLVEYLRNQGKKVEVIAFGKSTSSILKDTADEFINIEDDPKQFLINK